MIRGTEIRSAVMLLLCAAIVTCGFALPASAGEDASVKRSSSTSARSKTKSGHVASSTKSGSAKTRASSKGRKRSKKVRGQQKIDSQRAEAIQEALIRQHYLSGEATGTWDQASEEAMRRFQREHGWQDKTVPDSRALIKLGLGPSTDHLLNPESAMTTVPDPPKANSLPVSSHSSPAVANPPQAASPASTPVSSDTARPQ
jgi:peptidoglycan hydrolase-like protein with peptidoglycan-binding domain